MTTPTPSSVTVVSSPVVNFSGDIDVDSVGTISMTGGDSVDGANAGYVMIGHGGYDADDDSGEYKDAAKDAIGHVVQPTTGGVGGSEFDDGNSGDISVTVTGGRPQRPCGSRFRHLCPDRAWWLQHA